MQGSVFTCFSDMVIDGLGMMAWSELLDEVKPESGGVYTNNQSYADEELFALVGAFCKKTNMPVTDAVTAFGKYLFTSLYRAAPAGVKQVDDLIEFLLMVDSVIHVEVKRIYPDAYLPEFTYEKTDDPNKLVMLYKSKRKLCHLSEGLIAGAAEQFGSECTITHDVCMHDGADHCRLELTVTRN